MMSEMVVKTFGVCLVLLSWGTISCVSEEQCSQQVEEGTCTAQATTQDIQEWEFDTNGYIIFCLCMGRFGNQMDHLLGGMEFAKKLNRTLILPPINSKHKFVPFNEWFRVEPMHEYHKVILAEDFMKHLAPKYWPPQERIGFCFQFENSGVKECNMKYGAPFGPFWDALNVEFAKEMPYHISYQDIKRWGEFFKPEKYPVVALRGAPARYPVEPRNRILQRHLYFTDSIQQEAQEYIDIHFKGEKFLGLHLRTGSDFERACEKVEGLDNYMSSPQCLEGTGKKVTKTLCYPPLEEILRLSKDVVVKRNIKYIFVATDQKSFKRELEQHLAEQKVQVYHMDPLLPVIDLAVLIKSDYFIGNCISSFTAFVTRTRSVHGKPSLFWGLD